MGEKDSELFVRYTAAVLQLLQDSLRCPIDTSDLGLSNVHSLPIAKSVERLSTTLPS